MRILILTQYFAPEITAARSRLEPIARSLAERGHEVEVICEVPNHPDGVRRPGYGGPLGLGATRRGAGYTVRYVWVRAAEVKSTLNRVAFYGSYAAMATAVGAFTRRPDVVLASSPPLPVGAVGMAVAALHRVPWVMDVRDPWPEAAVALGELSEPRVIAALEALERRLYRSAKTVVTVNEAFRASIAAKSPDPGKVEIVANGTTREWMEIGNSEIDRESLGMPADRFVLTYAGNLGLSQGLEHAIQAAGLLDERFQLQLVGTGPRAEELARLASDLPSGRVVFRGLVDPATAARYLRASDASLVPLRASPEINKVVPSKLYDCCAVGRPVILASSGEARRVAIERDIALVIEPDDSGQLVGAVESLQSDSELAVRLSQRGRSFASEHLRDVQVERLEGILKAATAED